MSRELTREEQKFIQKINQLCSLHKAEEAEEKFENFIQKNPNNIEMLLRFAFFEYYSDLHDDLKCIHYLKLVLNLEPNNLDALLLLSDLVIARHDEKLSLFNRLEFVQTEDNEYASMIEYCKTLFYQDENNNEMREKTLEKSIELCSTHFYNNYELAKIYKEKKEFVKAYILMKSALKNIRLVYPPEGHDIDYTDYQEYFNELIKRVHVSHLHYKSYCKQFDELKNVLIQIN
jgi:tetratricopeptide (TPR) repeat protein